MMTTSNPIKLTSTNFLREVERMSGAKVSACLQCHKCSAGCPVGKETDLRSSQIMRLVQLGDEETLLASRAIWLCATCEACTSRCPMDIDVAAVIDTLRMLSSDRYAASAKNKVHIFNRSFLKSAAHHGRVFEMGFMAGYTLRTGDLFANLGKGSKMLFRGRLAFLPRRSGSRRLLQEAVKRSADEEKVK